MPLRARALATAVAIVVGPSLVAAAFTTVPAQPIQYVPFSVSDPTTILTSAKIANVPDCSNTIGGPVTVSSGTALFPAITTTDTLVYLCDALSNQMLLTITLTAMTFTPRFAFRNIATTLTFNSITPAGSGVHFRTFADCVNTNAAPIDGTLGATRQYSVTLAVNQFACVSLTAEATGQVVTVNAGLITVTDPIGFAPNTAIVSTLVTFSLSGNAPSGATVHLSVPNDCSGSTATYVAGGVTGLSISTTMTAPRGTYYFCVQITPGVYASAGTLTVLQFGGAPSTAFQNVPTIFYLTLDSPLTTLAYVATSAQCTGQIAGPLLPNPSTGQLSPSVTISTLGLYYLCVQPVSNNSQLVAATPVTVVAPYGVTFSLNPAVRGLQTTVTATPNPSTIVRFTQVGDCTTLVYFQVTTSSQTATFVLPTSGQTMSVSLMQVCVVTTDGTAVYPITTLSVRNFAVVHEATVQGFSSMFTFDAAAPSGSRVSISDTASCTNDAIAGSPFSFSSGAVAIGPFASTGTYFACFRSTSTVQTMVNTFTVLPAPSVAPNASLTQQAVTVAATNVPVGATVTIGTTCTTGLIATAVSASSSSTSISVTFPTFGNYAVCAQYPAFGMLATTRQIGSISVADLTVSPRYHVANHTSKVVFNVPGGYANPSTINTNFYLTLATSCGPAGSQPTNAITASQSTFLPPTTIGTYLVCVYGSGSGQAVAGYIPAGTLIVLPAMTIAVQQGWGTLVDVPFTFVLTASYAPSGFTVVSGGGLCTNSAPFFTGTFSQTWTSPPVALSAAGLYQVCVQAPDSLSMLPCDSIFSASRFQMVSTTYIRTLAVPVILTMPQLYPSNFAFDLFLTAGCGSASGTITNGVALTLPSRTYFVCVRDASSSVSSAPWRAQANNTVTVVEPFSAAVVSPPVHGNIPFNVSVTSDATSPVRLYLLPGLSRLCNRSNDVDNLDGNGELLPEFVGFSPNGALAIVPAATNVTVCVVSQDNTTSMAVTNINPGPYTNPWEVVKGAPTDVRSGGLATGPVQITSDNKCQFVLWGPSTLANYVAGNVTIPISTALTKAYWCEVSTPGGQWIVKDTIGLIAPLQVSIPAQVVPTNPLNVTWSPIAGQLLPGIPFTINLPAGAGTNPFVSHYFNCSDTINIVYGIFPAEWDANTYFVCVTSFGGTTYTTLTPTITVTRFSVAPNVTTTTLTSSLSLLPSVPLYAAAGGFGVRVAVDNLCQQWDTSVTYSLRAPTTYVFPNPGVKHICASPGGSLPYVAVTSFQVFSRPLIVSYGNPYIGPRFSLFPAVPQGQYSLAQGADSMTQPQTFMINRDRSFFFVATGSACVPTNAATDTVTIPANATTLSLSTASLTAAGLYDVCAPTPAGYEAVISLLNFTSVSLSPRQLVVDAISVVNISVNVSGKLMLSNVSSCIDYGLLAPIAVDARLTVTFDLRFSTGALMDKDNVWTFAPGTYYVCTADPAVNGTYVLLTTVTLYRPQQYSLSNTVFTPQVMSRVELRQDLIYSYIRGFSTSSSCNPATLSNGTSVTIFPPSDPVNAPRRVTIFDSANEVTTYYLCAQAPVNGSLVVASPIQFVRSPLQFPQSGSACVAQTVGFTSATDPLAASSTTTVSLYSTACCLNGTLLNPSNIAAVAARSSVAATLWTLTLPTAALDRFAPQLIFEVCVTDAARGTCIDLGTMQFDPSGCAQTLIPSPANSSQAHGATLAPGALVGGAPMMLPSSNSFLWILLLCLGFGLLILVVVVVAAYYYRKTSSAIPVDAGEDDPNTAVDDWMKQFQYIFENNRQEGPAVGDAVGHGALHVPIDLTLDLCSEASISAQRLSLDEALSRGEIVQSESFVFARLAGAFVHEREQLRRALLAADRAYMEHTAISILEQEFAEFAAVEMSGRELIRAAEEERRLVIAEAERMNWRRTQDIRTLALQRTIGREETWRSRKRRLMATSTRMLEHVDTAVALRDVSALNFDLQTSTADRGSEASSGQPLYDNDEPPRSSALRPRMDAFDESVPFYGGEADMSYADPARLSSFAASAVPSQPRRTTRLVSPSRRR